MGENTVDRELSNEFPLQWHALWHDFNKDAIEPHDIFNNISFRKYFVLKLASMRDKEEFREELRRELMYHFWSRCEYEIVVSALVGSRNDVKEKIDIYDQVIMNFDQFAEYCWRGKSAVREWKKDIGA